MPSGQRPADVIYEDAQRIRFQPSSRLLDVLRERNIYLGITPIFVPGSGVTIDMPKAAVFEEYCAFPFARRLYTNGAFSYSRSPESNLVVGRYCSIGPHLSVLGERHPLEWVTTSPITYQFKSQTDKPALTAAHAQLMGNAFTALVPPVRFGQPPIIGHDVWIGQNVQLARDITIGTGAVVGAGSVVARNVEPYTIVAGIPARLVRPRFGGDVASRLLASAWWDYHPENLFQLDATRPERFLESFEQLRDAGSLRRLELRQSTWETFV